MKNGRRPTVKQKKKMIEAGLNPNDWLRVKDLSHEDNPILLVVNKATGETKEIPA